MMKLCSCDLGSEKNEKKSNKCIYRFLGNFFFYEKIWLFLFGEICKFCEKVNVYFVNR